MRSSRLLLVLLTLLVVGCASSGPNPEEVAKEMYSRETLLGSAERALQEGNLSRALVIYQELLARDANDRPVLVAAALVSRDLNEYELSAAYHERLLILSPGDGEIRQSLAEINIRRQHFEAAATELKSLVEEDPNSWKAWNALGLIADLHGNYGESSDYYGKAIAANPANPDTHNNRGYSLIMAHRYGEAENALREGLRYDAANPRLNNNLLIALAWLGRYDEAVAAGRVTLDEWIAYNNVGYIAQLKGEYETAVRLYNAALSSSPRFYPTAAENLEAVRLLMDRRK